MRAMTRGAVVCATGVLAVALTGGTAFADNPGTHGQPNQSCEDQPSTPGHSADNSGSPFGPSGVSGTKYAGEQPQNSNNPKSVSQYDVACFQVSSH